MKQEKQLRKQWIEVKREKDGKMGVKEDRRILSAFFLLPSTPSLSRLSSYFKKHERKTHQTKRLLRRLNLVFRRGKKKL